MAREVVVYVDRIVEQPVERIVEIIVERTVEIPIAYTYDSADRETQTEETEKIETIIERIVEVPGPIVEIPVERIR